MLSDLVKKFEEGTGLKTEFDKEKFLKASKEAADKLNEMQKKLKEAYDQNVSNTRPFFFPLKHQEHKYVPHTDLTSFF